MKHRISNFISCFLLIGLLALGCNKPNNAVPVIEPHSQYQAQSGAAKPCSWNDQIAQDIDRINNEFRSSEKMMTVEKLVSFDQKLRRLLAGKNIPYPCKDDLGSWSKKYVKIGVYISHFENVAYSGELLVRAHKMNPYSKFRRYTLYSTIYGTEEFGEYGVMPNLQMAYRYKKEFPTGPFIGSVYSTLGGFYTDLYMVLRDNLRDYKYNCFKRYIDGTPHKKQMVKAKRLAENYFQLLLAIDSSDDWNKETLSRIQDGTVSAWSFCAD